MLFVMMASGVSGQHNLLHVPITRTVLAQADDLDVYGGQGPVWHFAVHWCERARCGLEQTESQVGMGSEQSRRAGNVTRRGVAAMVFPPHGQWSIYDEDRGHIGGLDDAGWHDVSN